MKVIEHRDGTVTLSRLTRPQARALNLFLWVSTGDAYKKHDLRQLSDMLDRAGLSGSVRDGFVEADTETITIHRVDD